jgi:hypothetical protein
MSRPTGGHLSSEVADGFTGRVIGRYAARAVVLSRFLEDLSRMCWSGTRSPIVRSSWQLWGREGAKIDE